ncbi:MAG TPA: ABC transporter permease [Anditalea sp.]|nr:ABC transporter permease [Anditalea sp.]
MKQLALLLKHDFILLHRNKIISISIFLTAVYVLLFKALSSFGQIEKFLVLIIFNDPALLGFLFIGVMVLFEKNENTMEALAVTPMKLSHYIISKSFALTTISICCCSAMVIAAYGLNINWVHFISAATLTTLIFSFLGFGVVAGESSFNDYILKAIGVILLLSVPFLGYFEIVLIDWFILFPSYPGILLFDFAFNDTIAPIDILKAYGFAILWGVGGYLWAKKSMSKNFS